MSRIRPFRSTSLAFRSSACAPRHDDRRLVAAVRDQSSVMMPLSDCELRERMEQLKMSVAADGSLPNRRHVRDVFALVCEAARREIGIRFYDVQLLAGIVLATGSVAEMRTGEGKTLVTALPACLGGIAQKGVHVATVNSYLARRDFETLRPVYENLGLRVGLLEDNDSPNKKRDAYACDITYGTGYEFGFDYLRDQIVLQSETTMRLGEQFLRQIRGVESAQDRTVQGPLAFAIIDEVDSVLIDEANTPLVISGPTHGVSTESDVFAMARSLAADLKPGEHYEIDAKRRTTSLTDAGMARIFAQPPIGIMRPWTTYIEQALKASLMLQRDVDYVVQDGEIRIVDQYTGRIFTERAWRDGLHQAVEAKEGVTITTEMRSLARISRQRFYQQYDFLCGMTGTASGHETELNQFYGLSVVTVPLRKPCLRKRLSDRFFHSQEAKLAAIADDIQQRVRNQQPVLIGTRTISASLRLAHELEVRHVEHQILNGVQTEEESAIISQAGRAGAVTIATNMAGRGTDIKLTHDARRAGGLHVISLEYHDSGRIDRQLEGRSGRQGDPGTVQFFVAADDELLLNHAPQLAASLHRLTRKTGETQRDVSGAVKQAQARAERDGYQKRCQVFQQQHWLDKVMTTIAEPTQTIRHFRQGASA